MKKEKSLGLEGLPSEFYQTVLSEIGFKFYEALKIYIIKVKRQVHKIISNFSRVQKMWKKLSEQL